MQFRSITEGESSRTGEWKGRERKSQRPSRASREVSEVKKGRLSLHIADRSRDDGNQAKVLRWLSSQGLRLDEIKCWI
jgi:hypothetical protein